MEHSRRGTPVLALALTLCLVPAAVHAADPDTPLVPEWIVAGSMSTPRTYGTVTALDDGRVLITGGADMTDREATVYLDSVDIFDPMSGVTVAGPPLSAVMVWARAVKLADGRVWVGGGVNYGWPAAPAIFDPASDTWTPAADLPTPRFKPLATLLSDGRVFVVGGTGDTHGLGRVAEIYDPATDTWAPAADSADSHFGGGIVTLADGRVLVAYGQNIDWPVSFTQSAEIFDPTTGAWTPTGVPNFQVGVGSAIALPDGRVAFLGAYTENRWNVWDGVDIYSPYTDSWAAGAPMPKPAYDVAATLLPDGRIVAAGGYVTETGESTASRIYDPSADVWTMGPDMNEPHAVHAVTLPNGKVLVTGGYVFSTSTAIEISGNEVPVADAGADFAARTCDGCIPAARVDASGSYDPDGNPLTYTWRNDLDVLLTTTDPVADLLVPEGTTTLTLTVRDPYGAEASDIVVVTMVAVDDAYRATIQALQSQVDTLTAVNTDLQWQVDALTAVNTDLQWNVDALTASIDSLNQDLAACQAGGGLAATELDDFGAFLAKTFENPGFTVPGATPAEQLENLLDALRSLNHGQQLAIYRALGGVLGHKKK